MTTTAYASLPATEVGVVDGAVLRRHQELAKLPAERLTLKALQALRYELELPRDERRRRVIERLRAWLLIEATDAKRVTDAFETAMEQLDAGERDEIRAAEEDAVMDGLSYREFRRLAALMPRLNQWPDLTAPKAIKDGPFGGALAAALVLAGSGWDV